MPLYGGETDPVVVLGLAAVWLAVEAKDRLAGDDDAEEQVGHRRPVPQVAISHVATVGPPDN